MLTRKMNVRITIFKREGGQNEDGEVLDNVRTDIMSCWAEVSKTTVKDFRENTTGKQADNAKISLALLSKTVLKNTLKTLHRTTSQFCSALKWTTATMYGLAS